MKKIVTLTLLVLMFGSLYGYHYYALRQFEKAYLEYAKVASAHDEAALIPMLPENPLRRDLSNALAEALTGNLTPEARRARADAGLALLVLSEGNIDAVGEVGEDATQAILKMEAANRFALLAARDNATDIIELAHRRASVIGDIRGLSYRANHHTKEIFDRILADGGEMTADHAAALDRLLPDVEDQFNRRSNLAAELGVLADDVHAAFADFSASW